MSWLYNKNKSHKKKNPNAESIQHEKQALQKLWNIHKKQGITPVKLKLLYWQKYKKEYYKIITL